MSATASVPKNAEPNSATTAGRLFFLDLSGGRILSANSDGSDLKTIISEGRKLPDGLALDLSGGHIYNPATGSNAAVVTSLFYNGGSLLSFDILPGDLQGLVDLLANMRALQVSGSNLIG